MINGIECFFQIKEKALKFRFVLKLKKEASKWPFGKISIRFCLF